MVQPWPDDCEADVLAAEGVVDAAFDAVLVLDFELPQPVAASGTSTRVEIRARCRTARKASDAP